MAHDGTAPLPTSTAALSRVVVPPDASAPRGPSPTTWVGLRRFAVAVLGAWTWAGANDAQLDQAWWWAIAVVLGALAATPSIALAARRRSLRTRANIFRAFCEATLGAGDALVASTRTVVEHAKGRPAVAARDPAARSAPRVSRRAAGPRARRSDDRRAPRRRRRGAVDQRLTAVLVSRLRRRRRR
jgi:hypothetical protein